MVVNGRSYCTIAVQSPGRGGEIVPKCAQPLGGLHPGWGVPNPRGGLLNPGGGLPNPGGGSASRGVCPTQGGLHLGRLHPAGVLPIGSVSTGAKILPRPKLRLLAVKIPYCGFIYLIRRQTGTWRTRFCR